MMPRLPGKAQENVYFRPRGKLVHGNFQVPRIYGIKYFGRRNDAHVAGFDVLFIEPRFHTIGIDTRYMRCFRKNPVVSHHASRQFARVLTHDAHFFARFCYTDVFRTALPRTAWHCRVSPLVGPAPFNVGTRPAAVTAVARVLNEPAATAVSIISCMVQRSLGTNKTECSLAGQSKSADRRDVTVQTYTFVSIVNTR
jgi:hypothetical protein